MTEDNSTSSNLIWALTTIIVVAIIAGVVYYSGFLNQSPQEKKIDINVEAPAAPSK